MKAKVDDTIKRAIQIGVGGGATNFTSQLVALIAKADPFNKEKIRRAFPIVVAAYEAWMEDPDGKVPDEVEVADEA